MNQSRFFEQIAQLRSCFPHRNRQSVYTTTHAKTAVTYTNKSAPVNRCDAKASIRVQVLKTIVSRKRYRNASQCSVGVFRG